MQNYLNPDKISFTLFSAENIPQISKHMLSIKPAFLKKRYAALDFFRQEIEESKAGLHHQPYTAAKKRTSFYKTVFLGLAALFFLLNITVMAIPTALGCGFLFSSCTVVKGIAITICSFLSIWSLTIGIRLKPEKEAISYYVQRTKAHLATIYKRKKINGRIQGPFALFGSRKQKAKALKQAHADACDKINDKKEETLHLAHRIRTAETLDPSEKEDLLNQAIEEFSEKLQKQIQTFRHSVV